MRKNRDVKFIIYQSLYIFVICVVAMKGANLDLTEVIEDDPSRARISEDSLRHLLEILKISQIVDTSIFVIVPKELLKENVQLRTIVENMPQIDISNYMPRVDMSQYELKKEKEEIIKDPGEMQEIRIGNIQFYQYHVNALNNPYDTPLEVVGVTTIPPKSSKSFEIGGQSTVTVKVGNSSKTITVKENQKPKIGMQRMASMGEDTRVSQLQSTTCYRVVISDDFPEQLDIKFSGCGISVKNAGGTTYDVTLNHFGSKSSFDAWSDGKDSPYTLSFTVTVSDKIAGHKNQGLGTFQFGEW